MKTVLYILLGVIFLTPIKNFAQQNKATESWFILQLNPGFVENGLKTPIFYSKTFSCKYEDKHGALTAILDKSKAEFRQYVKELVRTDYLEYQDLNLYSPIDKWDFWPVVEHTSTDALSVLQNSVESTLDYNKYINTNYSFNDCAPQ